MDTVLKPAAHSLFSASAAYRWLNCTASVEFSKGMPDTSSKDAEEGTLAHELAAALAARAVGLDAVMPDREYDPDTMKYCQGYADFVAKYASAVPGAVKCFEHRVDYSSIVPGGVGTADCLIAGSDVLQVIDFKFGIGVKVDAVWNPQMMLYALGALDEFYQDGKKPALVTMAIYQPRIGNTPLFTCATEALMARASKFTEAARKALGNEAEFKTGEWCRFCRAAGKCRALKESFDALTANFDKPAPDLTDEEIAAILSKKSAFNAWIEKVEAFATECALRGHKFPGMAIKCRTVRAYGDQEKVAMALAEAGIDPWQKKIKPLTAVERELGRKKAAEVLSGLLVQVEGKKVLAPVKAAS